MKKYILLTGLSLLSLLLNAQPKEALLSDSLTPMKNSAEKLLATNGRLLIGGYGEVHYNQVFSRDVRYNGKMDVHRLVLLFGYRFSRRLQFISEIEYEHVKEVFVEQAFLQYKVNSFLNIRGGLLLVPMGIVNEYHEPTAFNGVERPLIDKYIVPTTWREIGMGITGNIFPVSLRYQAYVINGLNSFNNSKILNGSGLRKGRQKGALSQLSFLNFSARVSYYGIRGLNIGLSGYFGKTQSSLFDGLTKSEPLAVAQADSSVVGVMMWGADMRYSLKGWQLRGQFYYTQLYNTLQYNYFDTDGGLPGDLGRSMAGFYLEAGYNVFRLFDKVKSELIPFLRYSAFNTQHSITQGISQNPAYQKRVITAGLTWKLIRGVVLKTDFQFLRSGANTRYSNTFNAGFGFMF